MSDDPNNLMLNLLRAIRDDMTGLRGDVMARIDRLQDTLTSIREDIVTNYNARLARPSVAA